jgi:hypothetical protein
MSILKNVLRKQEEQKILTSLAFSMAVSVGEAKLWDLTKKLLTKSVT